MTAVEAHELSMQFGSRVLWERLSFSLSQGKVYAITGPSGSGKSTLLQCIAGFSTPTSGRVILDGTLSPHDRNKQRRLRAEHLGFLFQNYALIDDSTVEENLNIATRTSILSRKASGDDMREALRKVDLDTPLKTSVSILSGGERQRLALARLLLKPKPLILADEPTGALDRNNADRILTYLRQFANEGKCVVMATHDPQAVAACDAVIDLKHTASSLDQDQQTEVG